MNNKVILSTDWHFGKSNGKFDDIILNGIYELCDYAKENKISTLFNLGDTMEMKQIISTSSLNYLAKAFIRLSETFENIFVIVGNHDMSTKSYDSNGHNLHILAGYKNVRLIDDSSIIEMFGKKIYLLPYLPSHNLKSYKFKQADYMFGHIEVQGFMLNQFVKAEEGISTDTFTNKYDHVYLGHFHKRQESDKITYIGNMCRFFYGEDDDQRGWTVLNINDGSTEFIEYKHPKMFKFKLSALMDRDDLTSIFDPGDNLKLVIDKNVKYSVMEEFKAKLILECKINELVLDDQYFAYDVDEFDVLEELENDDPNGTSEPTFIEYLITEISKQEKLETDDSVIVYLKELGIHYQE